MNSRFSKSGMALATVLLLIGLVLFITLAVTLATTYSLNFSKQNHLKTKVEMLARSGVSEFLLRSQELQRSHKTEPLDSSTRFSYRKNFQDTLVYIDPNHPQDRCEITFNKASHIAYSTDNTLSSEPAKGYYDQLGETTIPPFSIELLLNCHIGGTQKQVRAILTQVWPYAITATRNVFLSGVPGNKKGSKVIGDILVLPRIENDPYLPSLSPDSILGFAGNNDFSILSNLYATPLVIGPPQLKVVNQSLAPLPYEILSKGEPTLKFNEKNSHQRNIYYRAIDLSKSNELESFNISDIFYPLTAGEFFSKSLSYRILTGGWQIGDGSPSGYADFLQKSFQDKKKTKDLVRIITPPYDPSGTQALIEQLRNKTILENQAIYHQLFFKEDDSNIVEGDLYLHEHHLNEKVLQEDGTEQYLKNSDKFIALGRKRKGKGSENLFKGKVHLLTDDRLISYRELFVRLSQKLHDSLEGNYIPLKGVSTEGPRKDQETILFLEDHTLSREQNTFLGNDQTGSHYSLFLKKEETKEEEEEEEPYTPPPIFSNIAYHLPSQISPARSSSHTLRISEDSSPKSFYDLLEERVHLAIDPSIMEKQYPPPTTFDPNQFPHFQSLSGKNLDIQNFKELLRSPFNTGKSLSLLEVKDKNGLQIKDYQGTILEFFPSTLTLQDVTLVVNGSLILASPPDQPKKTPLRGHQSTILCSEDLYIQGGEIDSGEQGLVLMGRNVFIESGGNFKGLIIALENLSIIPEKDHPLTIEGGLIAGSRILLRNTTVKYDAKYMKGINSYGSLKITDWQMLP